MMNSAETAEFPLTAGQLQHLEVVRENPALRMAIWSCIRIPGDLDLGKFTASVETLVSRHEALRTEIVDRPGAGPRQRIRAMPSRADLISCQNVLARSEEQFSRYIRHIVAQEQQRPWDATAYPFRFRLFRFSPAVHVLMVGLCHLAVDRTGAEVLIRDLMRTYADALAGRAPRGLPRLGFASSVVMREAAAAGRESPGRADCDPALVPLLTRFDVPSPEPGKRESLSIQSGFSLAGTDLATLRSLARMHGCTEFTWILAAFARTVFRFTWQDRIRISVPVNLRGPAEREVVGMYVLAVPVNVGRPRDDESGHGFVAAVGSSVLRAIIWSQRSEARAAVRTRANLALSYQKMSGLDSRDFCRPDAGYQPRVSYWTPGMGAGIFSYPGVLDVHAVFDSGVFSAGSANEVSEALMKNLTSDPGR